MLSCSIYGIDMRRFPPLRAHTNLKRFSGIAQPPDSDRREDNASQGDSAVQIGRTSVLALSITKAHSVEVSFCYVGKRRLAHKRGALLEVINNRLAFIDNLTRRGSSHCLIADEH